MAKEKGISSNSYSTNSLREMFLTYFESHGHTRVSSSSLIPGNDPTILFTNAGMNQFKDVFLGLEKRNYSRATTVQKCLRAGGKHNDLENVGFTARHHTFFEMLGNFSFGDYFKKDAIAFAWEFVTQKLGIPKDRLYVTVHLNDDESADLWNKNQGISRDRIFRFDSDNFWQMADTGPCGPCTEIFFDRDPSKGKVDQKVLEHGGDRVMEIWNNVFMQFNQQEGGKRTPLPKPSVDTGMGLERLASVMQNVDSNYRTDTFLDIIAAIEKRTGKKAQENQLVPYRVIADHLRACSFLIADGVLPSNEGRGYVLRRILRRAIRFGRILEQTKPFIGDLVPTLAEAMGHAYPELKQKKAEVSKIITLEEDKFHETLEHGIARLETEFSEMKKKGLSTLDGTVAFKLYDTFGFPLDLTQLICKEQNFKVDEKKFDECMKIQQESSRSTTKKGMVSTTQLQEAALKSPELLKAPHQFVGYETCSKKTVVTCLLREKSGVLSQSNSLSDGEEGFVFVRETPFYAEGGGQVGDQGWIETSDGKKHTVQDTQKATATHHGHFMKIEGSHIKVGDQVTLTVNQELRNATAHNHSATHLLHSALRNVLGQHVKQSGSKVDPMGLRFDFSHYQATTPEELRKIENLANQWAREKLPVVPKELGYQEALTQGAMALFDEKYGDRVRTISMGSASFELCGGTHVKNTYECYPITILSESSVAAGVRRLEAKAGQSAKHYLKELTSELNSLAEQFHTKPQQLPQALESYRNKLKAMEDALAEFQKAGQSHLTDSLKKKAKLVKGLNVIIHRIDHMSPGDWKPVCDSLRDSLKPALIVLYGAHEGKAHVLAAATQKHPATDNIHCGKLAGELAAALGGRGGGRPDFAQAGGTDTSGLGKLESLFQAWCSQNLS